MKYRPPAPPSKNVLTGSDRDLDRLRTMAQEALDKHPAVSQGFQRIRRDLLDATLDARHARFDVLLAEPTEYKQVRHESVTLSVVLHVLILCATIFVGAAFLPGKGDSPRVLAYDVAWSTGAAYVTLVLVLIALFLPGSGSRSTRRQAWKINLFGVPIVAAGMAVAFSRSGTANDDVRSSTADDVAAADWTTWLIATSVVILMLLVLTAKTVSSVKSAPVEEPVEEPSDVLSDLDRDYLIATEKDKLHAIESVETLMDQHPQAKEAITRHWQDTVKTAAHKKHIAKDAAAHACRATAWRWQVEMIAAPDYEDVDD